MRTVTILISVILMTSCNPKEKSTNTSAELATVGEIIVLDERLRAILDPSSSIEIIADGYDWSEGPLWLPSVQKLIWSDVPRNTIYQWNEALGVSIYLEQSGYTGNTPRGGEMGSNGLLLDINGSLILCQHGDRRIARMKADVSSPKAEFESIAESFNGRKFSSPNDASYGPGGNLYFTDPPYGLEQQADDPLKEMEFNGVYKVTPDGEVSVMTKSLSRPNGIAFNKSLTKCYVANSDPDHAVWMVYDVDQDGNLINETLFFDATDKVEEGNGLPDGLKINRNDILFATGPGGVLIFTPEAEHLGTIHSGSPIANCTFNEDESTLFMTSDAMILKVNLVK